MAYSGTCHCGAVAFTVEGEVPASALSCNCSHCRRKGLLLSFVPAARFTLDRGEGSLATYLFNKHQITIISARPAVASPSRTARIKTVLRLGRSTCAAYRRPIWMRWNSRNSMARPIDPLQFIAFFRMSA